MPLTSVLENLMRARGKKKKKNVELFFGKVNAGDKKTTLQQFLEMLLRAMK